MKRTAFCIDRKTKTVIFKGETFFGSWR